MAAQQAPDLRPHKRFDPDTLEVSINALTYVLGGSHSDGEEQEYPGTTGAGTPEEEEDDYAALQQSEDVQRREEEE